MDIDLDTFLVALYTEVDDLYKGEPAHLAHRPGVKPELSDSEVLTLSVCAQWGLWDSERGFGRFAAKHLRHLFPRLLDQSQFNRRRRALYPALTQRLGVDLERERLLDTKPVSVRLLKPHDDRVLIYDGRAAVGWCQAKRQYYYGFKLVLSLSLDGVIVRYEMVPANADDREAAAEVMEPGCRYWADKGFAGKAYQREWLETEGALVRAQPQRQGRLAERLRIPGPPRPTDDRGSQCPASGPVRHRARTSPDAVGADYPSAGQAHRTHLRYPPQSVDG